MTKIFTDLLFATTLLTITTAANAEFEPTKIEATDVVDGIIEKQYLGWGATCSGDQFFVGAASTAVATKDGSNSVYVYNIDYRGRQVT